MKTPKSDQPIFTAADVLAQRQRVGILPKFPPPRGAILCYQPGLMKRIARRYRLQKIKGFFGDLYLLKETGRQVAAAGNFGIGAPAAVVILEDLVALGVKKFFSIGIAGGLQDFLQAGDLIVCERAIRDEGTSRHYLADERHAEASPEMVRSLQRALDEANWPYRTSTTWTTDAPYRELRGEVEQHNAAGVAAVDMEAAALFAAGQALKVQVGAAFSIGDSLNRLRWQLDFDSERTNQGLDRLFEAAVRALMVNH